MARHDHISPALTLPAKGEESRVFAEFVTRLGAPSAWKRDVAGLPSWLLGPPEVAYGPFLQVVTPAALGTLAKKHSPEAVPILGATQIQMPHLAAHVRRARGETLDFEGQRDEWLSAATATEREELRRRGRRPGRPPLRVTSSEPVRVAAWLADGHGCSARQVAGVLGLGGVDDDSTRTTARSYVSTGRKLLNDFGALPWTLWEEGLPPQRWWETDIFALGLLVWHEQVAAGLPMVGELLDVAQRTAEVARSLRRRSQEQRAPDHIHEP